MNEKDDDGVIVIYVMCKWTFYVNRMVHMSLLSVISILLLGKVTVISRELSSGGASHIITIIYGYILHMHTIAEIQLNGVYHQSMPT